MEHKDVAESFQHESIVLNGDNISDDASASSDCSLRRLDLALNSFTDTQTNTKTQDGPSFATLVTNALIRSLIKNRSTTSTQVADFLRAAAAAAIRIPPTPPPADACPIALACPNPEPALARLCLAVQDSLRALSHRIEARGKTSILPCTTNLHRSFLPGLRFLMMAAYATAEEQDGLMEQG